MIALTVTLECIVATLNVDHIIGIVTLGTIVVLVPLYLYSLGCLLTPTPVMWRKDHLSDFSVLQRVRDSSNLFYTGGR
jgi:hypothetical protein